MSLDGGAERPPAKPPFGSNLKLGLVRPTGGGGRPEKRICDCRLSLLYANSAERPGAVQGARGERGGANPGQRGPFCKMERKGKAAGGLRGCPPGGGPGQRPA